MPFEIKRLFDTQKLTNGLGQVGAGFSFKIRFKGNWDPLALR